MIKLCNINSKLDGDLLLGLLEAEGIKADTRFTGAGSYLNIVGNNFSGSCEIWVQDVDYVKAQEIYSQTNINRDMKPIRDDVKKVNTRVIFARVMLLIVLAMFLIFIGMEIWQNVQ